MWFFSVLLLLLFGGEGGVVVVASFFLPFFLFLGGGGGGGGGVEYVCLFCFCFVVSGFVLAFKWTYIKMHSIANRFVTRPEV